MLTAYLTDFFAYFRNISDIIHCCGYYSSNTLLIFLGGFIFFSVILLEVSTILAADIELVETLFMKFLICVGKNNAQQMKPMKQKNIGAL